MNRFSTVCGGLIAATMMAITPCAEAQATGFAAGIDIDFYFDRDEAVPMFLVREVIGLKFRTSATEADLAVLLDRHPALAGIDTAFRTDAILPAATRFGTSGGDVLALVRELAKVPSITLATPAFRDGPSGGAQFLTGSLLVRWRPEVSDEVRTAMQGEWGIEPTGFLRYAVNPGVTYRWLAGGVLELPALARAVHQSGLVLWAIPDCASELAAYTDCVTGSYIPDDTYYGDQAHLCSGLDPNVHADFGINAPAAWAFTVGDPNLRIAILDTQIEIDHEDLDDYMTAGLDAVDDDSDPGCGFLGGGNHGTKVAGLAAAEGDNSIGITGVAQQATIIPVRVLAGENGLLSFAMTSDVVESFTFARQENAAVINCSWGNPNISTLPSAVEDVLDDALVYGFGGYGCCIVFAAGNSYNDPINPYGAYEPVLTVSNLDIDATLNPSSSHGPELDLTAPGTTLTTTGGCGGGYTSNFTGTSAAAPVVAGTAFLVRSANPWLHQTQVAEILKESAVEVDQAGGGYSGGFSEFYGYGRVDAGAAVELALTTPPWKCERYGSGTAGTGGLEPQISANQAPFSGNEDFELKLWDAKPQADAMILISLAQDSQSVWGGTLLVDPDPPLLLVQDEVTTDIRGKATYSAPIPADEEVVGMSFYAQWIVEDSGGPSGYSFSKGLKFTVFAPVTLFP